MSNKTEKMSRGVPLTDEDLLPWPESLRDAIRERLDRGEDVAVSCSALRLKYQPSGETGTSGASAVQAAGLSGYGARAQERPAIAVGPSERRRRPGRRRQQVLVWFVLSSARTRIPDADNQISVCSILYT
ncbi:uncharacterized protein LOC125523704 [Triticum urartu]|uniref:uncharacterized protein LOC125523704 n=1 Tax=Triticum urartu TaxID=4572 RepID=UPI0020434203|nr:uncharacterized protein LOC125523704 [Triticum urartu]